MNSNDRNMIDEELPRLAMYLADRGLHAADAAVLMAIATGHTAAANSTADELAYSVEKLTAVLKHSARMDMRAH